MRAGRRAGCALFPCGAAAVANTILAFVEQGDHVLMMKTPPMSRARTSSTKVLARLGVSAAGSIPLIGADIARLARYPRELNTRVSGFNRYGGPRRSGDRRGMRSALPRRQSS